MAKRTKTIKSLANDLHNVYDSVKNGSLELKKAKVITAVADKIISCSKTRLHYKSLVFKGSISRMEEFE